MLGQLERSDHLRSLYGVEATHAVGESVRNHRDAVLAAVCLWEVEVDGSIWGWP